MAKKKDLNLEELLKQDKDFEKSKRLDLTNKITLYYAKALPQRKVDELFKELLNSVKFDAEHNIKFFSDDENVNKYLLYLIVKYFTNLEEALVGQDLYVNIDTFNQLYDKGFLSKVLVTLDEDEVGKVQEAYANLTRHVAKVQNDKNVRKQMALELAKNPELTKLIEDGKVEF